MGAQQPPVPLDGDAMAWRAFGFDRRAILAPVPR